MLYELVHDSLAIPPRDRLGKSVIDFLRELGAKLVRGHVNILMQGQLAQTEKRALLLKEFTDYPLNAWETHAFGNTIVFIQAAR